MRHAAGIAAILFLGLFATLQAKADPCNGVASNPIVNCGFETGDFTGWGGTAPTDPAFFANCVTSSSAYQGNYVAFLGSSTPDTLSQTFATTPGALLTLQFALMQDDDLVPGSSNSFTADIDGTTLFSETDVNYSPFVLYTFTAVASGTSSTLTFTSEDQDSYFELDSVSIAQAGGVTAPPTPSATPEPGGIVLLATGFAGLVGLLGRQVISRSANATI